MDALKIDSKLITLSRSQVAADAKEPLAELLELANQIATANRYAETAYWWFKGVDQEVAEKNNVSDQLSKILSLLTEVDNISLDIVITIRQKADELKNSHGGDV